VASQKLGKNKDTGLSLCWWDWKGKEGGEKKSTTGWDSVKRKKPRTFGVDCHKVLNKFSGGYGRKDESQKNSLGGAVTARKCRLGLSPLVRGEGAIGPNRDSIKKGNRH